MNYHTYKKFQGFYITGLFQGCLQPIIIFIKASLYSSEIAYLVDLHWLSTSG